MLVTRCSVWRALMSQLSLLLPRVPRFIAVRSQISKACAAAQRLPMQ
jgi:hypothetical protein